MQKNASYLTLLPAYPLESIFKITDMNPSPITQQSSLAIDLSRIKSIRINANCPNKYELIFELTGRVEYSKHPETLVWEKEIIHEEVKLLYDDFEMANAYLRDWVDSWKDYNLQQ